MPRQTFKTGFKSYKMKKMKQAYIHYAQQQNKSNFKKSKESLFGNSISFFRYEAKEELLETNNEEKDKEVVSLI